MGPQKKIPLILYALILGTLASLSLMFRLEIGQYLSTLNKVIFFLCAFVPLSLLAHFPVILVSKYISGKRALLYIFVALIISLTIFLLDYSPVELMKTHIITMEIPASASTTIQPSVIIEKIKVGGYRSNYLDVSGLVYQGTYHLQNNQAELLPGAKLVESEAFLGDMVIYTRSSFCPEVVLINWDETNSQVDICQSGQEGLIHLSADNPKPLDARSQLLIKIFWGIEFILCVSLVYFLIFLIFDRFILKKATIKASLSIFDQRRPQLALLRDSALMLSMVIILILIFNIKNMLYFSPYFIFFAMDLFYQFNFKKIPTQRKLVFIVIFLLTSSIIVNFGILNQPNPFMQFLPTIKLPGSNSFNALVNNVSNEPTKGLVFGYDNVLLQRELRISQQDANTLALNINDLETQARASKVTIEMDDFPELTTDEVNCLFSRQYTTWRVLTDTHFIFLDEKYFSTSDAVIVRRQNNRYFLIPSSIDDIADWCQ